MNTEQKLLEKWRELPKDKQQEVLQFVESIAQTQKQSKETELGQRLRQIRAKIIASGSPLLDREEIEKEMTGSNRS
ncbi:MAG: hypothetical protein QNJ54_26925 [Prochloraceae cyanobacterium]|nr:hypothetical protein [Prochloraceae cyanobacterium]